ncbi:hypothetical protein ACMD2_15986 [Ananas comosus]|uniref:AATF leucine zipper-containing domain-containing protein n=1 Tax=Ananas comosus TaxID=4615 RepID=A0A199VCE5_ANACO|nr:hypothetical protein ACMD2_15986 [Ananas comosus]
MSLKALWDKSLELRFLLQKAFARSTFCGSDIAVNQAYSDLIQSSKQTLNCMLELQEKISDQVSAYMRDTSRMIKRMQLRRSSVDIFGKVPEEADNKNEV